MAVGLNSLWGIIHTMKKELGMSWNEIMWKRSWINCELMLADAGKMVKKDSIVVQMSGKDLATRFRNG